MKKRSIAGRSLRAIGYGCMSLSPSYGPPPVREEGARLLHLALDLGCDFLDTAAVYGLGGNETLIGQTLAERRDEFFLASKCGLGPNAEGKRELNGRPEAIRRTCEISLRQLRTDRIDLYYLHRLDPKVPIEESVGALGELVKAGKIGAVGLSEVSASTLRRAHKEYPIAALQSEYSLWSRNAELGTLEACRELGVAYVAFSPVGRGFLTDNPPVLETLDPTDMRHSMPRFHGEAYQANLRLLAEFTRLATGLGARPAQVALAWLLAKDDGILPSPGTGREAHLRENLEADQLDLTPAFIAELDALINEHTVTGGRYGPAMQAMVDTEAFEQER